MTEHGFDVHRPRLIQSNISPVAAVGESLGCANHLCANRVQVDVAHRFGQILISLTAYCLVAALKEVANLPVFAVVVLAVAGKQNGASLG